jgi:formamidopyrimidine-DNA glycosylase
MPELPEVETARRGVAPHVLGQTVRAVAARSRQLRWPVPENLDETLRGQEILDVQRRGKYLLFRFAKGTLIVHLGMSGSLRMVADGVEPKKHDHVDIALNNGLSLRFHDPRRFGCILWTDHDPLLHPLLAELGPEPLEETFSGRYLREAARGRAAPVKTFIMDGKRVVGVGNIYASEALFRAGIHPRRAAGSVSLKRCERLAGAIKAVLGEAIAQGGTTLRDFVNEAGNPGYFQQTLAVYGRDGQPCIRCGALVRQERLGQRSSFYCPRCQR